MMSTSVKSLAALSICLLTAVGGCASSSAPSSQRAWATGRPNPNLVLPGTVLYAHTDLPGRSWPAGPSSQEFGRNDEAMGVDGSPPSYVFEAVEIRTHDRLRVSNGRPHDWSNTRVRTIQRRENR